METTLEQLYSLQKSYTAGIEVAEEQGNPVVICELKTELLRINQKINEQKHKEPYG